MQFYIMKKCVKKILSLLPVKTRAEIERLAAQRGERISEIRLRAAAKSTVTLSGERIPLLTAVSAEEVRRTVSLLCEGSIYAHRENIGSGYISLEGGIRVGLCGRAVYDGGGLVGIADISSLVFRIPTEDFFDVPSLLSAWEGAERGMLIYSPPGVGKTTALRALVKALGSGKNSKQIAVIDERGEFSAEDYEKCTVDILCGYKRAEGAEIALRTLAPEIIAVDEIGSASEAEAITSSLNSGVKVMATAHAKSLSELYMRSGIAPLLRRNIFDVFTGIAADGGIRSLTVEHIREDA